MEIESVLEKRFFELVETESQKRIMTSTQIMTKKRRRGKEMQMCGNCMKVYDESEYAKCPFCSDDKDEYTHVIVFDRDDGVAKSVPKENAHLYE